MFSNRNMLIMATVGIVVILSLIWLNRWIGRQVDTLKPDAPAPVPVVTVPVVAQEKEEVVRKTIADPSREFYLNSVFMGDKEIASFKNYEEKIFDFQGDIPDGKVKFINETDNAYGEEQYRKNKRHGMYREYYDNGNIHKEIEYSFGKRKTIKEYLYNGQLRMEADYHDALVFTDDAEAGRGRIYYHDGTMMYEWNLTNSDDNRFKKSYNIKGELTEAKRYDVNGKLVETVNYRQAAAQAAGMAEQP